MRKEGTELLFGNAIQIQAIILKGVNVKLPRNTSLNAINISFSSWRPCCLAFQKLLGFNTQ